MPPQMELKQALADAKKEAADNDGYIQHWSAQHDKLELLDIEYAVISPFEMPTNFP